MRRCIALSLIALALLLGQGCDDPAPADPPVDVTAESPTPSAPAAPEDSRPARIRFDLARHVARASLHHGDALVVDLGTAAGHQHTLGGWRTRVGDTRVENETTTSLVRSVTGFYVLPLDGERCHLSMRARGFASSQVALYIDDETIGHVRVPTDGTFGVVSATVPDALCTAGEHDLRVRVPETDGGVGLAVDWIRVGTPDDDEVGPPASLGDGARLAVPDEWTLAFPFEVPENARFRGVLEGEGSVTVSLERDGESRVQLDVISAGAFDLDLSPYAEEVIRLRLRFSDDAALVRPAVVTLDGVDERPLPRVRNVLVYLTDTLRADHLRPYAPETRVHTPGLNRFATHAATFLSGHAQENWTKPSCATLLSGLFPWEHHATSEDAQVPGSVELLSERLKDDGFHTGAFIANGFVSDRFGFRQGWSTYRNYVREGRRNLARFVAADVISWLDERPEDTPFFLYVHSIDPHVPYIPPSEELARYDPDPYDGPVDFHQNRALLEAVKGGSLRLNARDRVRLEALYDGEISYHDRHFDAVMEALERRGLAEETLVVFTSDHGEEFWDHDSVGHGHSVWEELIHVPLLVRWPGLTDDAVPVEEAVGLVDVVPTALEALGREVPDDVSGRSLAPLLRGQVEDAPRPVVTGFMEGWRTVVVGRYKLIQRTTAHYQVYDLSSDPDETEDLAPTHPILLRYLRGLLGMTLADAERGPAHVASRTDIDDTLREQLEALGYAGASRAPTTAEAEE
ncbi:MAG: sulfatase [Sandaracinaceae bacterium]